MVSSVIPDLSFSQLVSQAASQSLSHVNQSFFAALQLINNKLPWNIYSPQTPLHLAAITKQPHALDCLLRAGANPRLRDRHGNTVVHIACTYGDGACLKALLNHSAPKSVLNLQNYQGKCF